MAPTALASSPQHLLPAKQLKSKNDWHAAQPPGEEPPLAGEEGGGGGSTLEQCASPAAMPTRPPVMAPTALASSPQHLLPAKQLKSKNDWHAAQPPREEPPLAAVGFSGFVVEEFPGTFPSLVPPCEPLSSLVAVVVNLT